MHVEKPQIAPAVNLHITSRCSSRCRFCFGGFADARGDMNIENGIHLLDALREVGVEKVTFAGGEPTLHPRLGEFLEHARRLGFVTAVVSNGYRLDGVLARHAGLLDWVGLSVDSGSEATQFELGRGAGDHIQQVTRLADRCHQIGLRVKLNTVVNAVNWQEDMGGLIQRIAPDRWKLLQVLRVEGQNSGIEESLLISLAQFEAFASRHKRLMDNGMITAIEDNDAVKDSYVMIDPNCRFFGNTGGAHQRSQPILDVGIEAALAQVGFQPLKFLARGGRYQW